MENDLNKSYRNGFNKGIGFGVILLLVGIVFLGLNFGVIPMEFKHIIVSWPMLLIVIGIFNYFRLKVVSGTILLLVGGFFLLPRIIDISNFASTYWPLLLIAAGIIIIVGKIFGPQWGFNDFNQDNYLKYKNYGDKYKNKTNWNAANGGFSKNSVFGSGEHIVLDPEFKGGEINAVFGGIKLDLRRTNLPIGETHLEINAVFGGVTIYIPNNWMVVTNVDAVFGGFEDRRLALESINSDKKLIITGACVFGGGELLN